MKVQLQIDTHALVRALLVLTAFGGGMFILWRLVPVLLILAVSFFLALALNTPVSRLARLLPGHSRIFATAFSYIIVVAVLGSFLVLVAPPIIHQINILKNILPDAISRLGSSDSWLAHLITQYHLRDTVDQFVEGARHQTGDIAKGVGSNVVIGVSTFLTGVVTMLTVLVLTFMMLIEGPSWVERLWGLYRDKALLERHQQLTRRMYQVVVSYVNGQVLVAAIAALTTGAVLLVLTNFFTVSITAVLPLSLLIFFTTLIPMIGQTIGAILIAIALLFTNVGAALAYTAYFLIYQQVENNIIQPAVQSRTVELTALSVLVAVIVGIVLLGPVGGFLAVPVAGCLRVLVIDYFEHRKHRRPKAEGA